MRYIDQIILHCSATPEGRDYTVEQIRQWHLKRGFNDIGYHYVIYRDGSVHKGRSEEFIGAHTKNHNKRSIGGMTSDMTAPKDTRTPAQKAALFKLVAQLQKKYPDATVHGHYEFANKACPCFNVQKEFGK